MGYDVEKIFEDVAYLSKVRSKKEYENNIKAFKQDRYSLLEDMVSSDDIVGEAKKFCDDINDAFKKFGKVRGADMMNLNYFAIYYIFPTILSEEENGNEICDTLRDAWNDKFKTSINYTDYESLHEGFQTKIFGIPIGDR